MTHRPPVSQLREGELARIVWPMYLFSHNKRRMGTRLNPGEIVQVVETPQWVPSTKTLWWKVLERGPGTGIGLVAYAYELRQGVRYLEPLAASGPIPGTRPYTVRDGDTMLGIAARFHIEYPELLRLNPQIKDPDKIYIGQVIRVPA